ncbi:MAG: hypothetical protein WAK82_30400 [Streptosporangiaceae bacterium]
MTTTPGPVSRGDQLSRWPRQEEPWWRRSSRTIGPGTPGDAERVVAEHVTTVLTMEIARLQGDAQSDARLRTNLVLDLVAGTDADAAAA